jgi:L-fuculose-phosphate aldolase
VTKSSSHRNVSREAGICREMIAVGHRLDQLGYVPGAAGNISAKVRDNVILLTPTGGVLAALRPADLVRVALDSRFPTRGKPTCELDVHAQIYAARPDVNAVIHAHPPACVGFSVARKDFGPPANIEIYALMGMPLLVPFAPPGKSGPLLAPLLTKGDAFFLANHGIITLGATLQQALHRVESMENFACALLTARLLGGPVPLSEKEMEGIRQFMKRTGLPLPRSASAKRSARW